MKIKLSKSQWEKMGKEAGWMKTANLLNVVENVNSFKKWIMPNLQGIISNYTVNPQSIGTSEAHAKRIEQLTSQLISEIEKLGQMQIDPNEETSFTMGA